MRKIALDIAPATETHCGVNQPGGRIAWCPRLLTNVRVCSAFMQEVEYDKASHSCKRLPACRAAEVKP